MIRNTTERPAIWWHSRGDRAVEGVSKAVAAPEKRAVLRLSKDDRGCQRQWQAFGAFDRNFCPLQEHTGHRWLSIARARQEGKSLPPVKLVQVGEAYYCLDGHHRISVARAFQQPDIEATVTVWQVEDPRPAAAPAGQQRLSLAHTLQA